VNPDRLQSFCLFIGYPRSGHSLVAALLDAHRDVVLSHEVDALARIEDGATREELFDAIAENAKRVAEEGRLSFGYRYAVPGQHQGVVGSPRVMGDKKGGGTTLRLGRTPELLASLRERVKLPLRVIHIVRNPYDNIATLHRRRRVRDQNLADSVASYFRMCETNLALRRELEGEFLEARHEDIVADPRGFLLRAADFLELDAPGDWVEACAATVFDEPRRTRSDADWEPDLLGEVEAGIERFEFLRSYAESPSDRGSAAG
jgi:hypothetical protein